MSDQPSDPPASGANDPEPEGSDANAIASTEETQTEMPEEFDLKSTNMDQLMADFVNSIDPIEMAAYFASFDPPRPRPPLATSNERALSSYLIQMQVLGGIPREELEPMQHAPGLGHIRAPSQLVLVNNEFRVPIISSATFNGRLAPLFITEARQVSAQSSNNGDSLDQEIGADANDIVQDSDTDSSDSTDDSGSFEMPRCTDDVEILMDVDMEEDESQ